MRAAVPSTSSIALVIDSLLSAPKTLGGSPAWRDMQSHDQHRLVMPLLIGGESTGLDLEICAYPNTQPTRFTIIIRQPRCVWRLDYSTTDIHTNSLNAPDDIRGLLISGPHYHAWADNRHLCTNNALPDQLRNARVFPASISSFNAALEWFCAETNILPPPAGLIVMPARTRLL